jgi:hypothetical protein
MANPDVRIKSVAIDHDSVAVTIGRGLVLRQPISTLPLLVRGPTAVCAWEITADGCGLNWPTVGHVETDGVFRVHRLLWDYLGERISTKDQLDHALTSDEERFLALYRLSLNGSNGGLLQFFCNEGNAAWIRAKFAAIDIGAPHLAEVLDRFHALLDRFEDWPDLDDLWDICKLTTPAENDSMQKLDEDFWRDEDGFARLAIDKYISDDDL